MHPQRNAHSRPRAVGGGRSPRYAARRAGRPDTMQYAPEWSDAAAAAVLQALQADGDRKVRASALKVLESPRELEAFAARLPLTADGRGLAEDARVDERVAQPPALVARLRELVREDGSVPACGAASTTSDASQIERRPRPT